MTNLTLTEKSKLPPANIYSEFLNIAANRFNLDLNEFRNRFGLFTVNQWEALLNNDFKPFTYVVIQPNNPIFERQNVLTYNKYLKSKKYAFICKGIHKDGSESTYFIEYSNDLNELQKKASGYQSWYNYPAGFFKSLDGTIKELN